MAKIIDTHSPNVIMDSDGNLRYGQNGDPIVYALMKYLDVYPVYLEYDDGTIRVEIWGDDD